MYIVTGCAGFIGFHLCKSLIADNIDVTGIDNFNAYYNPEIKMRRNNILIGLKGKYKYFKCDISDYKNLRNIITEDTELILHLAAQAGVRYSLTDPWIYEKSNILGTINIFECARKSDIKRVIFASSSSVYGGNKKIPFSEEDSVDKPVSLYAATKKSTELLAHAYSHLYGIDTIGLRFFTVYGEFGRPDMAMWKFTRNLILEKPIEVYNFGKMGRDFTYISDIISGIKKSIDYQARYEIFNLGNSHPISVEYLISLIEKYTGKKAIKKYLPMQPGDVPKTWADIEKSRQLLGYSPKIGIEEGTARFVKWFIDNSEWTLKI